MAKKIVEKKWTDLDEMTLDHLYTSHNVEIKDLAIRFHCSTAEIRNTLNEMGIYE